MLKKGIKNKTKKGVLTASASCWTWVTVENSCMQDRMALTPPSVAKETLHSYFSMSRWVSPSVLTTTSLDDEPNSSTSSFSTLSLSGDKIKMLWCASFMFPSPWSDLMVTFLLWVSGHQKVVMTVVSVYTVWIISPLTESAHISIWAELS